MNFYYLSDLHLLDGNSDQARRLCGFLRELPKRGDTLVLGGDIFDLFVGNKRIFRERFSSVLQEIAAAAERGVRTIYLEGNHDFQIRAAVSSGTIQVEDNDFSLDFDGKKIWISHGDMIDPEDKGYRFLRWITRTLGVRLLIWLLPGMAIDAIGNRSSKESRKYNERRVNEKTKARLRSLYFSFAEKKFSEGFRFVLVGHSHIRDLREGSGGTYVNLGFSSDHVPYARLGAGSQCIEIKQFS